MSSVLAPEISALNDGALSIVCRAFALPQESTLPSDAKVAIPLSLLLLSSCLTKHLVLVGGGAAGCAAAVEAAARGLRFTLIDEHPQARSAMSLDAPYFYGARLPAVISDEGVIAERVLRWIIGTCTATKDIARQDDSGVRRAELAQLQHFPATGASAYKTAWQEARNSGDTNKAYESRGDDSCFSTYPLVLWSVLIGV